MVDNARPQRGECPRRRVPLLAEGRARDLRAPLLNRRRFLYLVGLAGATSGLTTLLGCGGERRQVLTTLERTILIDSEGVLRYGPGEPYQVLTTLAEAQVGREGRRRSLVVFHHFADALIVDEESPLRGEWVDSCPSPISTSAFHPQEALSLHITASLIRQANRLDRSPVTGRPADFLVHTGNAADNAQYNELRWFLDLMDGRQINPDSGAPGYEGVQEESPDPRYPDLLQQAQQPFRAERLRYPWYAVVGNRDLLAQGNFPPSDAANGITVGGRKVIDIAPARKEEVCNDPTLLLDPRLSREILLDPETEVRFVSPDPDRRLLSRQEWIAEHFKTAPLPGPQGHGFLQSNLDEGTAYYTFEHGPITFIVLDTVNQGGFAAGGLDREQFRWLEDQLVSGSSRYWDPQGKQVTTENPDRLFVILSHHPAESMNNPLPDPSTGQDLIQGEQFEELLHRFPNVILHVAGHSRANRIHARPDPKGRTQGYWEVTTSSQLDFPVQARLLEITDNGDGTLSIFSTVYDMSAPIEPGEAQDPTPRDDLNEERLASVARQVAAHDPQIDLQAAGLAASDRNAEMLLTAPFDLSGVAVPPAHLKLVARRQGGLSRRGLLTMLIPPLWP